MPALQPPDCTDIPSAARQTVVEINLRERIEPFFAPPGLSVFVSSRHFPIILRARQAKIPFLRVPFLQKTKVNNYSALKVFDILAV